MKRLVAVILMVALVLSLSVTAFALNSPQAEGVHKVYVIDGIGSAVKVVTLKDGEFITFEADASKGKFDYWSIFLMDGKTPATLGEHYTLQDGESLTSTIIHLYPKTDLIVTGNYDGKKTEVEVGQNGEVTSPQTGDTVALCLAGVMLLSLAGMLVVGKKRFA